MTQKKSFLTSYPKAKFKLISRKFSSNTYILLNGVLQDVILLPVLFTLFMHDILFPMILIMNISNYADYLTKYSLRYLQLQSYISQFER